MVTRTVRLSDGTILRVAAVVEAGVVRIALDDGGALDNDSAPGAAPAPPFPAPPAAPAAPPPQPPAETFQHGSSIPDPTPRLRLRPQAPPDQRAMQALFALLGQQPERPAPSLRPPVRSGFAEPRAALLAPPPAPPPPIATLPIAPPPIAPSPIAPSPIATPPRGAPIRRTSLDPPSPSLDLPLATPLSPPPPVINAVPPEPPAPPPARVGADYTDDYDAPFILGPLRA